jgi:hypothetical protein
MDVGRWGRGFLVELFLLLLPLDILDDQLDDVDGLSALVRRVKCFCGAGSEA